LNADAMTEPVTGMSGHRHGCRCAVRSAGVESRIFHAYRIPHD
jgi:hypothetical protein